VHVTTGERPACRAWFALQNAIDDFADDLTTENPAVVPLRLTEYCSGAVSKRSARRSERRKSPVGQGASTTSSNWKNLPLMPP